MKLSCTARLRLAALPMIAMLAGPALAEEPIVTESQLEELLRRANEQDSIGTTPLPPVEESATGDGTADQGTAVPSRADKVNHRIPNPEEIDAAEYRDQPLPEGRSALTVKLQVLLDRAAMSPGVIDGYSGGMTGTALRAFERQQNLPVDGVLDGEVWDALGGAQVGQVTKAHVISPADVSQLTPGPLPNDYAELAKLDRIGFTRVSEAIAEQYHMDEDFLIGLNPGLDWVAGETVTVVDVTRRREDAPLARIVIDKPRSRLQALDVNGRVLSDYPVTIGSDGTPSPSGTHLVTAVAPDPTYSYNPDVNFQQGDNTEFLTLPPGPNGPVGSTWIDLDKPTYGLHGTSEPSKLFTNQSHGCVRMTNWDAGELARMVTSRMQADPGVEIEVVFVE
ncbi:L,D-transpeptidase [Sulfitobacter aestuarii]|uniref:L,D-transpeptidase n=1 Tax=Sulfitobacter aestuarii TaxID=2161676 RepID=A0ABW5U2S4_9RHOB